MQKFSPVRRGAGAGKYLPEYAYDADDQPLVYWDTLWLCSDNGVGHRLVVCAWAHGQPFVRKRVDTATATAAI
jgi:hypothetical protein